MTAEARRTIIFGGTLTILLLFLWRGEQVGTAVSEALLLSAKAIVPALLPSLLLSGLVSTSAIGLECFDEIYGRRR